MTDGPPTDPSAQLWFMLFCFNGIAQINIIRPKTMQEKKVKGKVKVK